MNAYAFHKKLSKKASMGLGIHVVQLSRICFGLCVKNLIDS